MRLKNAYKKAKKGSIIKSSSIPGSHVVGMPGGGVLPNSLDKNLWKEPNYKPIDKNTRTGYDGQGTIYYDPNSNWENINNPEWLEHEKLHHLQWLNGTLHEGSPMSTPPLIASNALQNAYYNRRSNDLNNQVSLMIKENPSLQFIPKEKLISGTTSNAGGQKSFLGAEDLIYSNPKTLEGEARTYEDYIAKGGKPLFKKGGLQNMPNGGVIPIPLADYDKTMAPKKGNYLLPDINRPSYIDSEGGRRSEYKMGVNINGEEVLIPTVVNGRQLSGDEAVQRYKESGLHMGKYKTPTEADYYSRLRTAKYNVLEDPVRYDSSSFRDGGKYLPTAVSQELARKKEGGKIDHSNDADMVNGVASILRRVKDKKNRLQLANQLSNQFNREKVRYNLSDFLNKSKVKK